MTNLVVLTKPASMITISSVIAVLTRREERVDGGTVGTVQMEGVQVLLPEGRSKGAFNAQKAVRKHCLLCCCDRSYVTVFSLLVFLISVFGVFAVNKDQPMPS
jgi:hypothetical protein